MELYQLRSFVAVADEGALTKAAEKLCASQPAVSAHVKALEEELSVCLFERTPKGMRLTEAGKLLRDQARQALASADEMLAQARALREETAGDVKVGFNTDPDFLRALDLVSLMRDRHPKVNIHLCQCVSGLAPDDLRQGVLDAAYVYGPPPASDVASLLLATPYLLVAGPASWKARLECLDLDGLAALPWIMTPSFCPFTDLAEGLFKDEGLKPNQVLLADNESLLKALAVSEMGVCLMREDEARAAEACGEVSIWPKRRLELPLRFIYLKKRENDRLIQALAAAARQVWNIGGAC